MSGDAAAVNPGLNPLHALVRTLQGFHQKPLAGR